MRGHHSRNDNGPDGGTNSSNSGHQNGHHNNHGQSGLEVFTATFTALNNSGVTAQAQLILDTVHHDLTVRIDATGMTPNEVHLQHIHGFLDNTNSTSPTLAQDTDHDGFVELVEGLATYGQILLNLTNNPLDSVHDHGTTGHDHTGNAQFPTADANGELHYLQTFHFDPSDPNALSIFNSIEQLDAKEIVLHGETVAAGSGAGTPGEVDGTGGFKLVLPVASGELHQVTGSQAQQIIADIMHQDHDFMMGHHG